MLYANSELFSNSGWLLCFSNFNHTYYYVEVNKFSMEMAMQIGFSKDSLTFKLTRNPKVSIIQVHPPTRVNPSSGSSSSGGGGGSSSKPNPVST